MVRRFAILPAVMLAAFAVTGAARAQDAGAPDLEAGKKVFRKCAACHMIGAGAKNRVGPELDNVVGRTAGTAPDFSYSEAMLAAGEGGLVWSPETLDTYLADPRGDVPGNKMAFAGLKSEADRKAVIAYLVANGAP